MNKMEIITQLGLQPHPLESGYFLRTYTAPYPCDPSVSDAPRVSMSSIFYMLTDDQPIGYFHKNRSDIVHYFHGGGPIKYHIIHPDGRYETVVMGEDLTASQQLQLLVEGGSWKASELLCGEYGLISEAVTPGFDYADMEIAVPAQIQQAYPQEWPQLMQLVKNES